MGVGVRLRVKHGPSEGVARTPCACEEKGEEKGEEKISASEEKISFSTTLRHTPERGEEQRGTRSRSGLRTWKPGRGEPKGGGGRARPPILDI